MSQLIIFIKKELTENIRNYKGIILLSIFLFIGIISPLIAKITPEILKSVDLNGAIIELPEPTYLDSYMQFFKNISQIGIVTIIIVFSGTVSRELNNNSASMMFSKGLKKGNFLLAKYISSIIIFTIAYVMAALITYGYTASIFESSASNLLFSFFTMYLFGIFILSVIKLSEVLTKSNSGALLLTLGVIFLLFIGSIWPQFAEVSPLYLASVNMELINGTIATKAMNIPIITSLITSILCIIISINIFKRKEI